MRLLRTVPDRLLTLGAIGGGLVVVLVVGGLLLGLRPVFLQSGSMAPAMPTGTLALVRDVPAAELVVGDVVCVETGPGRRVTHRVVGIERVGAAAVLRLRGDANAAPDPTTYTVQHARRVVADVGWLGYPVGWLGTPAGHLLLGTVGAGMLVLLVRGGPRPRTRGRRRAGAAVAASTAVLLVGPVSSAGAAPWTDAVGVTATTFTAATVPAPATFTCGALGVLSVRFNWAAVPGATDYTLHHGAGGGSTTTTTGTTALLTAAISGGTAWVVANRDVGSTTWSSGPSPSRSYTVAVVSLCA